MTEGSSYLCRFSLKTFCEMNQAIDAAGDKEDATDAKIDSHMKQLGSDFTRRLGTLVCGRKLR